MNWTEAGSSEVPLKVAMPSDRNMVMVRPPGSNLATERDAHAQRKSSAGDSSNPLAAGTPNTFPTPGTLPYVVHVDHRGTRCGLVRPTNEPEV